ncbi:response regulator transcription factor [Nonomuraea sp. NN258]|uniref:response regulator n=1 Tax=Nonomuraea antri TaxID=2730852 RepID=UPI00156A562D|nr:response regulator transcription factor [Nonomuraea antri]NRQ36247.1 response regulator transcription factor [Nonomuraea antri]
MSARARAGRPISVVVADDRAAFRRGLALILATQPDLRLVGEAEDGYGAVELARSLRPDVVLMDMDMPGMSGTEAARALLGGEHRPRIVLMTTYDSPGRREEAAAVGASGLLLKVSPPEHLLALLRAAGPPVTG